MSTNVNNNDQVNDIIDNKLKFGSINSLANNPANDPLTIFNISLRGGKIIYRPLVQV